ncbi:MAG: lipid-A-disaccharide synthase, partial [Pyrinomonadaceae bacterium]
VLHRVLHGAGLKIIYYVSPQLWAWRSYRVRNIRRDVDLVLSILPFEPAWYRTHGIEHVEFVGHPLTYTCWPRFSKSLFCAQNSLDEERPIVALMPGSRRKEIHCILPPLLEAAAIIGLRRPEVQFVIPLAPMRRKSDIESIIEKDSVRRVTRGFDLRSIKIVEHQTHEALAAADAAAVASGTATLEAGLIGTPLVIVYKVSAINWHTLGRLINVNHYGLINLVAGGRVATELIQNDLTGERLAKEIDKLLEPERNAEFRLKLKQVTEVLRGKNAAKQAAHAVLHAISHKLWM